MASLAEQQQSIAQGLLGHNQIAENFQRLAAASQQAAQRSSRGQRQGGGRRSGPTSFRGGGVQRDNSDDAADLIQQAQAAFGGGGGGIELNGQTYEDAAPPVGAEEILSSLSAIEPLARSGALNTGAVRGVIGKAVSDVVGDQRQVRKASRDLEAITRLQQNGTHTAAQTAQAKASLEKEYGLGVLSRTPGYAEIAGIDQQIAQERGQAMDAYAQANGWDRKYVTWDDKSNQPVPNSRTASFDASMATIDYRKAQSAQIPAKVATENKKIAVNSLDARIKAVSNMIATNEKLGLGTTHLTQKLQELNIEQYKLIGQPGEQVAAPAAAQGMQPAMAPAAALPAFDSRDAAIAAARSGSLGPGSRFTLGGIRYKVGPDGVTRRD